MELLEWVVIILLLIWAGVVIFNRISAPFTSPVIRFPTGNPTSTSTNTKQNQQNPQQNRNQNQPPQNKSFQTIADKYKTYAEVQDALRAAGLESSNLIIGVDYTKSNEYTGKRTFQGKSLHFLDPLNPSNLNPYQRVITALGHTLEAFDDDKCIPAYGFGDIVTSDKRVFPFIPNRPCNRFIEVLEKYDEITPVIVLSGPTSFAPLIREAIRIVDEQKSYHILIIIADGQVTSETETRNAIVEASSYPLSIVLVGVGDGPWEMMREFDDELPARKFDNFQFVNATEFFGPESGYEFPEVAFSVAALQEIPDQFKEIRRLRLL